MNSRATATAGKVIRVDVTAGGEKYQTAPVISFSGGGGSGAAATSTIQADIDRTDSYGDNNKFKTEAADVLFSVTNPFGEVDKTRNTE